MTISKSYFSVKTGYTIVSVFLLFFLLLASNYTYGQPLDVTASIEDSVSCHGIPDGQITATGSGSASFQYSLDKVIWYPASLDPGPYTFTDLAAGNYRIYVRDADPEVDLDSFDIVLVDPDELSMTLGGQSWSCGATPGCSGSVTTSIIGGTAPYVVSLNSTPGTPPFTALCAGPYTVDLTDFHGCTVPQQNVTISLDNVAPTCLSYPPNRLIDAGSYNPTLRLDTINLVAAPEPFTGGERDTLIYGFDASNYNNLQLKITAHQTSNPGAWVHTDSLQLSYSIDGGSTYITLLTDSCQWTATETNDPGPCNGNTTPTENGTWFDLTNASGVSTLALRVICYSGDVSRFYTLDSLKIRYNGTTAAVTRLQSGEPVDCSDNFSSVTVTPKDSALHWYCNAPGNLEFKFIRIWEIIDNCGNKTRHFQNISVGSSPTFATSPRDTIFDFCNNAGQVINGPTGSDNCGTPAVSWVVTTHGTNVSPSSGTGRTPAITFPRPVLSDTLYVITWTVTDSAGFTNTGPQNIVIRQPLQISLTPGDADFCSGESASFSISVVGGTGNYDAPVITPAGTWSGTNSSGTYTTSNLILGVDTNISVTWEDNTVTEPGGTVGGCQTTTIFYNTSSFRIHENITTNPLERP